MKHLLITILSFLLLSSPLFGQSEEKPCYISVSASDEFNQTLLSNMSISIISQYFKEIKPLPPGGLSGTDNCIYDVTVSSEGGKTVVTLHGKDMNSFGDSNFVGLDGFQQSLLKSLYRSLKDKRKLICEGYGEYLVECGGGSSLKDRGVEGKKCYLTLQSNDKKKIKLYTNISVSIISQYVTKVEKDDPLIKRPLGKSDSCLYEIDIEQTEGTLFLTVTGEGLNSYGDSELSGIKGFQQSLLKSLFRSLRDKRGMICDDYRDLLEECKDVVVEELPRKVEPKIIETKESTTKVAAKVSVPKVEPKVVKTPKVVQKKVQKPVVQKKEGKNLFVTVGSGGTILNSRNGKEWTLVTSGTRRNLYGVTYGKNLFVTVGEGGTILNSRDGKEWISGNSKKIKKDLKGVTYGNRLFVTVGDRSILVSRNGKSWKSKLPFNRSNKNFNGVTYGKKLFVTVGDDGTILTSTDGNSWNVKTSGILENLYGVTYGNNLFVTVGDEGTILTSTDGNSWNVTNSWTSRNLTKRNKILYGVKYLNGIFMVVGAKAHILTSRDGNSWNLNSKSKNITGGPGNLNGVTYGNGFFVTVGDREMILRSSDTTTWTSKWFWFMFRNPDITGGWNANSIIFVN